MSKKLPMLMGIAAALGVGYDDTRARQHRTCTRHSLSDKEWQRRKNRRQMQRESRRRNRQ